MKKAFFLLMLGVASFLFAADPSANPVIRIMPLGDSITHGSQSVRGNGYRAPLYVALTNLGYNVDFVGTQTDNYSKVDPFLGDSDHEGHSSWCLEKPSDLSLSMYDHIQDFFAAIDAPHLILLHLGTNDGGDGETKFRSEATNRLVRLLDRIHACQPSAKVVVTTLMKRYTTAGDLVNNWKYTAITNVFNPAVPGIVAAQRAKGQDAYFLDMHAHVDFSQISDTVHPNDVGYTNMANAWVSAVQTAVPDPATFTTENDLAVVKATATSGTDGSATFTFAFNQKVASASACNAANWTITGTAATPAITLSANQRTATVAFPADACWGESVTVTAKAGGIANATGGRTLAAASSASALVSFPQGAEHYVPTFADFELLYDYDIRMTNLSSLAKTVVYNTDNTKKFGRPGRVAYYLELQKSGQQLQYVWVEMDAFTNDVTRLGVPTGWRFQQDVHNLLVYSNVADIRTNELIATGNIEFWPESYSAPAARGLSGASSTLYDFDDTISTSTYGSMQVHDTARGSKKSCIFAYNRFASNNNSSEVGIGPCTTKSTATDWTQTYNSGTYTLRHLQVYVTPDTSVGEAPELVSATLDNTGTLLDATFSTPVDADSLAGAFALSEGRIVSVTRDANDYRIVHLVVAGGDGAGATLSVAGVRDTSALRVPMAASAQLEVTRAPHPAGLAANVPDALREGYELIYSLDSIPTAKSTLNWSSGVPYDVNAAKSFPKSFDRVAYYLELVSKDKSTTNFAWTSFDVWTNNATCLGLPINKTIAAGQRWVRNQDVYSNVGGVVNGVGMDGGFIEFWPFNYGAANKKNIPGASASVCDFGDEMGDTGHFSCLQVHNVTNAQTVIALGNFCGNNGNGINVGIGNNTKYPQNGTTGNPIHPDWTQTYVANSLYSRITLHILVRTTGGIPARVLENVPSAADYTLLYDIDVPAKTPTAGSFRTPSVYKSVHTVDNRTVINPSAVSRVGYYFELVSKDQTTTNWCWAAFDAFSKTLADYTFLTNKTIQRKVGNLEVASNVSGVKSGTYDDGNIEFIHTDYGKGTQLGTLGAKTDSFDWDDNAKTTGSYSCFQIHNYHEKQTLIAIGHFNSGASVLLDVGIGNSSVSTARDWTQTYLSTNYYARRLYVFVKGDGMQKSVAAPTLRRVVPSLDRTQVCVGFSAAVRPELLEAGAWSFTAGGAAITDVALNPLDDREVLISLAAPLAASASHTLQYVYDLAGVATKATKAFSTQGDDPLPAFLTAENVPELGDYVLVNKISPGTSVCYTWNGADYSLDESRFRVDNFDRVAYLMHLVGTNGVTQWVWASMDAFTDDLAKIGVPTSQRGNVFQRYVDNLHVYSARSDGPAAVTCGEFADGNIEFFVSDYSVGNGKNIPGASATTYDFGDVINAGQPTGYGCMQIHNYRQGEVVFALSHIGNSGKSNVQPGLGIGNRPSGNPDYTTHDNAKEFSTRGIYVFVRPVRTLASKGNGPTFLLQPSGCAVKRGTPCALHAFAKAATRYQWFRNGQPILGATDAWLDLANEVACTADYAVIAYADDDNYTVSSTASVCVYAPGTLVIFR